MPSSAYIHIPFCKKKCNYCSFISFDDLEYKQIYIEKLSEEIRHFYKNELLKTLYFGGGTPSLLDLTDFKKLLALFNINENTEITVEINPESASFTLLKGLRTIGVNRLSIGVQSFDNKILAEIGRLHDSKLAIEALHNAKKAGFKNISLDLIYGLPNQSLKNFQNDLKKAVQLEPEHISLYGLKIEKGTKFAKKKPVNLANEDLQACMYLYAIELLEQEEYAHYEFSNFAKAGYESKHNLNYWNNQEYYGFGLSAHGYLNGERFSNQIKLQKYIDNPFIKLEKHQVTAEEKLQEKIFLGFRKCSGMNVIELNKEYDIDFDEKYKNVLKRFLESGHILKTDEGYKLSNEGILLSNSILCEFI